MITRDSSGRVNNSIQAVSEMKVWEYVIYVQLPDIRWEFGDFLRDLVRVLMFIVGLIIAPVGLPIVAYKKIRNAKRAIEAYESSKQNVERRNNE